jgi:hypothetical protein
MAELQVTQEQLQALYNAITSSGISLYHGYQVLDPDVANVNQNLKNSGVEVPLVVLSIDFPTKYGSHPLDSIENAITKAGDKSGDKLDVLTAKINEVGQALAGLTMYASDIADTLKNNPLGLPAPATGTSANSKEAAKRVLGALLQKPDVLAELETLLEALKPKPVPYRPGGGSRYPEDAKDAAQLANWKSKNLTKKTEAKTDFWEELNSTPILDKPDDKDPF